MTFQPQCTALHPQSFILNHQLSIPPPQISFILLQFSTFFSILGKNTGFLTIIVLEILVFSTNCPLVPLATAFSGLMTVSTVLTRYQWRMVCHLDRLLVSSLFGKSHTQKPLFCSILCILYMCISKDNINNK